MIPGGDASETGGSLASANARAQYQRSAAMTEGDMLGELADGTGGTWIHNTNDLADGFKRMAVPPEYYYILGFSPREPEIRRQLSQFEGYARRIRRG